MADLETTIDRLDADEISPAWESSTERQMAQPDGQHTPAPMAYAGVAVILWLSFLRPFEWISAIYAFHVAYLLGVLSLLTIAVSIFGGHKAQLPPELKVILL